MSKARNGRDGTKTKAGSRITNGSALLPSVDGRSTWARLMRDISESMVAHLGGEDHVTEPSRMTIRRVAALEAELVHLEDKFARERADGKEPSAADLDLYSRLANGQRRHFEAIGYERRARDVTPPSVEQYLAHKRAQAQEAGE